MAKKASYQKWKMMPIVYAKKRKRKAEHEISARWHFDYLCSRTEKPNWGRKK